MELVAELNGSELFVGEEVEGPLNEVRRETGRSHTQTHNKNNSKHTTRQEQRHKGHHGETSPRT